MRHTLAILLLLAAVFHPLAHIDEPLVCAAAHGALVEIAAPALAGLTAEDAVHTLASQTYIPVAAATQLPARAPPVA